ncbi:MAG: DUF4276 family protein [Planctomycetaceae bacterium]|nr:DUF4276 family protein [Planctomycetaceae bacterium]
MQELNCFAYVEDEPSAALIRRLVRFHNSTGKAAARLVLNPGFPANMRGYGPIKAKMDAICKMAAANLCVMVLTDLDTVKCAPELIRNWTPLGQNVSTLSHRMWFRIAVREVESWLIADREALAAFLNVAPANLNATPDNLPDPKQHLLNTIRTKCRANKYREMLPTRHASIGVNYNPMLVEFIEKHWDPGRAVDNSDSLRRALNALALLE